MSNTRHRNASGPFVIFDPGLGISGSLEISGLIGGHDDGTGAVIRTGINPGIQIATDTFVTGTLKVGANHRMSLTDNELDISSGDLTLDVAGNIEINADGGTITFKDDASTLGTITSAGFSGTATAATTVVVSGDYDSDVTQYLLFSGVGTGNPTSVRHDDELTYNPSTGTVTATNFAGTITGHASSASRVNVTANTDNTAYPILFSGDTSPDGGNEQILADSSVTLNPNSNTITATTFAGALSGNATTATALVTGRTLKVDLESTAASTAFDGSANITDIGVDGTLPVANGGTGAANAATALSNLGAQPLHADLTALSGMQSGAASALAALTSTEIGLLDGGTSVGSSITIQGTDGFIINDGGTMKLVPASAVQNYAAAGGGGGGVSLSNDGNNRITTAKGDGDINGESNLTFDGTELNIKHSGTSTNTACKLNINQGGDATDGRGAISITTATGNTNVRLIANQASGGYLGVRFDGGSTGLLLQKTGGVMTVSFTGQHRNVPEVQGLENKIGHIVVATGAYNNFQTGGQEIDEIYKPNISHSLPVIRLSSKRNQKSVFGVIESIEESGTERKVTGGQITHVFEKDSGDDRLIVNSIGEGGIWVCNINGNLENGDYITTCEVPGLGMKQDSEMLCNYTVAKITQDCNFRINASNYDVEEFEFEGKTYRKAFVGCTYHCG